jgi:sortase (surface protein transpeptidase)
MVTPAAPVEPATQASADLPDFTHRSARLDDVAREPVELRIPALGVRAAVSSAGIADDGQLAVPVAPDAVVWYGAGSVPGAAGSAVLAGHVDYNGQRGIFYNLGALERGDAIRVDLDDGTTHRFVVERVERHAKSALPADELFTRNGGPVLTLITCGGDFDRSTRHYADNTVVRAALRG